MICVLALLLAVVLRIADPMAPAPRGPGERMLRRYVAAELDDRSWRERMLRLAADARVMDRVVWELTDPTMRTIRAVHNRLDQPTWTGLVKPARPWAVWPTYMGQPHRVPGATMRELQAVAA